MIEKGIKINSWGKNVYVEKPTIINNQKINLQVKLYHELNKQ